VFARTSRLGRPAEEEAPGAAEPEDWDEVDRLFLSG
jgi:hypothetical protein